MTILWCGGEEIDFAETLIPTGVIGVSYRSGYSRCSIWGDTKSKVFSASPITSCWLHSYMYRLTNGQLNLNLIGLIDSSSNKGIWLRTGASSVNTIDIVKYNGSTYTILTSGTGLHIANSTATYDLNIINFGSSCTINFYINQYPQLTWSGDLTDLSISGFNAVAICGYNAINYASEVIVADQDTRLMSLVTLYPSAAGDTSSWTGAYTDINETLYSDSDLIYSSTADQESQFNLSTRPAGSLKSLGLKIATRATKGTDSLNIKLGIRSGTTTYLGSTKTVDTRWTTHEDLYQVNPITGVAFTNADIDSLQVAVKSITV
jgi:hypothetical protein